MTERDRQAEGQRLYGTFEYRHYAIFLSRPTANVCNKHIIARSEDSTLCTEREA